ncbi:MAG TPA: hypothetical protein VEB65_03555 [Solirubrobacterales bacterium]|nr:hypothetical protein [Solirubrobacterales bacterium]
MRPVAPRGLLLAALGTAVLLGIAVQPAGAATGGKAKAPAGFFGVVPQARPSAADLERMQGSVEVLRFPIYWSKCEPRRGEFDFAAADAEIADAAAHGIRVLPFVYGRPAWLGGDEARPPLGGEALSAWRGFLRRLVARYGPQGTLWKGDARRQPIRRWQVWNEPNFRLFWKPRVSPPAYARLLHASATAIRGADPRAQIVLAGIAPVGAGMKTWVFMRRLLRVDGVRADFDLAALHPYSVNLSQLDYQVSQVRAAMAAGGAARKPLLVTEIGVASDGTYPSAFVRGFSGQAEFLEAAYSRLLAMRHRWRIAGAYWFTWRDQPSSDPHCSFCQGAGLLDLGGHGKPAWTAFRHEVARARLR